MKRVRITTAAITRLITGIVVLVATASTTATRQAVTEPAVSGIYRGVSTAVHFDVSPPLSELAQLAPEAGAGKPREIPELPTGLEGPLGPQDLDTVVQSEAGPDIPSPSVSFDSLSNTSNVSPPDPVGDVGPNHYVAMSNLSYAVYSKTGTLLAGPSLNNTLWTGFGGDCETDNSGDPIVVYDQLADRWILTQFTASGPTYFNCVAISTGPNPTGTYFRYAFSTGVNFPDYPKYGVWPDAYYISTREFAFGTTFVGVGAYAVNRAQMLVGNPNPQMISFLVPPGGTPYNIGDGLLPSDLDGSTGPPSGSPNYFVGSMDDGGPYGAPQDALTLWKFVANFANPPASSFTLTNTLPVAPFDSMFSLCAGRECIPQPGTVRRLDHLGYRQRPTWRLAYRNFGTHESLVTNQSVEATAGVAGVRWWELRSPNSSPTVFQQGTYAPNDGIHRWMGSIAMDRDGNAALGFSVSNGTAEFPGVRYTGRLSADPPGSMPQGEGIIVAGTGSQTGSARWGDYTSMNVDPVDDCTFWYVNEYVPVTSSVGWRLRVGAFKFASCGTGGGEPDLVETAVSDPPAVAVLGQTFSVEDTAQNQGDASAGPTTTRYYLSPDTIRNAGDKRMKGKRAVPGLAAGETSTGNATVGIRTTTAVGLYFVLACADDRKVEPESDEGNNCRASATQVDVRAPDLIETSVSNPPANASPGDSFSVTDNARNQGNANAGASTTRYYFSLNTTKSGSDIRLTGTRAVPGLAPSGNSTGTVTVTIPNTTPGAQYFLLACADDKKDVVESDETNQCKASATKVTVTP
jgi:hypothetical protein